MQSWAARSLQVGALCTLVDVTVVVLLVRGLKVPTPLGSAAGVAVGSTLAFILNRAFAFRDKSSPVGPQAFRYALTTLGAMAVHAPLVGILVDRLDVNLVVAKLIADVLVFSVGQLLLLRFLVFRKSPAARPRHGNQAESGS
jgi:putative flippase GtrA